MSLFIRLQSFNNTKLESAAEKKLFGIGRGDLSHYSWVQPTYSALLLIPKMVVPHKCGTMGKVRKQAFQRYETYCQKALLQHRNHQTQIALLFVLSVYDSHGFIPC